MTRENSDNGTAATGSATGPAEAGATEQRDGAQATPRVANIWLRVISGLVMAAIGLGTAYLGTLPFAILTFLVAAVMAWEWTRIVRGTNNDIAFYIHIAAVLTAAILTGLGMAGLAVAAVVTGSLIVFALLFGRSHSILSMLGVVYTGLPVIALGWMRGDGALGFRAALLVIAAVAVTDTFAYFSGRTIGGAKLMPSISPNKTWAGLIGGVLATALFGLIYPTLSGSGDPLWLAGLGAFLAVIGQAGDLAESALKRRFALKDASALIPGHGGVMDRMDGVVTASIAAGLIAFAIDLYAPARALLYGS